MIYIIFLLSLSSRRAWIEIINKCIRRSKTKGRSPHGERGLKFRTILYKIAKVICRSPHGERGLKSSSCSIYLNGISSLSSRRAWIEIRCTVCCGILTWSLSSRRAWIEIYVFVTLTIKNCGRTVKKFLLTCIVKRCINIYILFVQSGCL